MTRDEPNPLPDNISERVFQERVIALARLGGWRIAHFRPAQERSGRWSTPMQGHTGYPDLTLARDGRVIFAELKTNTGSTSSAQRDWLEHLNALTTPAMAEVLHGARDQPASGYPEPGRFYAVVWRPRDWHDIKRALTTTPRSKEHQS